MRLIIEKIVHAVFDGLTINNMLTLIIFIFFFNTVHVSRTIKLTDNVFRKDVFPFQSNVMMKKLLKITDIATLPKSA